MGLRLLKVKLPLMWLGGLWVGLILPAPGSLLVVETVVVSVLRLRPGLVLGVVLVGLSLPRAAGDAKPWMVLETRAETVGLRSGEAEGL